MEKLTFSKKIKPKTEGIVSVGVYMEEYKILKAIADECDLSIAQVTRKVIRHGLSEGYEILEEEC